MGTDYELIKAIKNIRERANFKVMHFLRLLLDLAPNKGKKILNKIQLGDKEVQKLSDLLHMKKKRTDNEILNEIESIRAQNNTLWMDVVRMCFELDAKRARQIFKQVKECDRKIQKLSEEISKK